jgi:alpha-tubulin suppressor-like RCC1 family protein
MMRSDGVKVPLPRFMTYLKDYIITEVSAGLEHVIAVTIEGRCYGWGNNEYS